MFKKQEENKYFKSEIIDRSKPLDRLGPLESIACSGVFIGPFPLDRDLTEDIIYSGSPNLWHKDKYSQRGGLE